MEQDAEARQGYTKMAKIQATKVLASYLQVEHTTTTSFKTSGSQIDHTPDIFHIPTHVSKHTPNVQADPPPSKSSHKASAKTTNTDTNLGRKTSPKKTAGDDDSDSDEDSKKGFAQSKEKSGRILRRRKASAADTDVQNIKESYRDGLTDEEFQRMQRLRDLRAAESRLEKGKQILVLHSAQRDWREKELVTEFKRLKKLPNTEYQTKSNERYPSQMIEHIRLCQESSQNYLYQALGVLINHQDAEGDAEWNDVTDQAIRKFERDLARSINSSHDPYWLPNRFLLLEHSPTQNNRAKTSMIRSKIGWHLEQKLCTNEPISKHLDPIVLNALRTTPLFQALDALGKENANFLVISDSTKVALWYEMSCLILEDKMIDNYRAILMKGFPNVMKAYRREVLAEIMLSNPALHARLLKEEAKKTAVKGDSSLEFVQGSDGVSAVLFKDKRPFDIVKVAEADLDDIGWYYEPSLQKGFGDEVSPGYWRYEPGVWETAYFFKVGMDGKVLSLWEPAEVEVQ